MTHQLDVAPGRDVVARWCNLAEQRLEYLTELFETGRWRRYHSELAFLENIQEAKAAVETWRDLSIREASRNNSANDMSWLGHSTATLPRGERPRDQAIPTEPRSEVLTAEVSTSEVLTPSETEMVLSDDAPSAPDLGAPAMEPASELTLDIAAAIAERYPSLRNAM